MIPAILVHGAKELFIFGAIILPFWTDIDVSELIQIKYVFWQILIEEVSNVIPVRGNHNIYAFRSYIVLQNVKYRLKSLKIDVFDRFSQEIEHFADKMFKRLL